MPFSYSVALLMLNLQLRFGVRCFSWFSLAERENIISNSKQWQTLVCCSFEGALNIAEGKKTLPISAKSNMQKNFLLFTGFLCPTQSWLSRWGLPLQWPVSHHLCFAGPYWVDTAPANSSRPSSEPSLGIELPREIQEHPSAFSWAFTNMLLPTKH